MAISRELPHSFGEALKLARTILSRNSHLVIEGLVDVEAELVVLGALRATGGGKLTRMELYSKLADRFPEPAGERVIVMASARSEGKPLQYLTGFQQFLSNEYEVGPGVLVPRPETEFLVDVAMTRLGEEDSPPKQGIEIGLGSGIISVELLLRFPTLEMTASEISKEARAFALRNAAGLLREDVARLTVLDVADAREVMKAFEILTTKADFIISNPPYLTAGDEIASDVLAHEPKSALFAPPDDALHFYRAIAENGKRFLKPRGLVFLEVPHERAGAIQGLFHAAGWEADLLPDLTDRERVLIAEAE